MNLLKSALFSASALYALASLQGPANASPGRIQRVDSAETRPISPVDLKTRARPNILLVLADDMGYSDLGMFGSGIRTPNLDSLARRGLLFTQFYNEAKCTESRAALLSGRPSRAVLARAPLDSNVDSPLAPEIPTLAEALQAQGYDTYISGKWHLGERPDQWPDKRGFAHSFSLVTGASSYFEMRMREAQDDPAQSSFWPSKPFMIKDGARWPIPQSGFFMTDAIADTAREMISEHSRLDSGKPFFLYLAFTAPHFPLHAPAEDIARYKGKFDSGWSTWRDRRLTAMKTAKLLPPGTKLASMPASIPGWETIQDKGEWARRMEVFAAQLDRLDKNLGKVISELKATGQYDNTLILFLSDNGAASMSPEAMARDFGYVIPGAQIGSRESNTAYGEPWAAVSNTPLRSYKQSLYEGGMRTPMIAFWPEGLKRRGTTSVPGQINDLFPTLVSLAGGDSVPAATNGVNLAPLFSGRQVPSAERFWAYRAYRAVRLGQWKAVSPDNGKTWQLFNLANDAGENMDLAGSHPDRVRSMASDWMAWSLAAGKPYEKK
ncbi:sulfatase-like hydrolase/transferase [Novosphingobium sp. AS3R-12]|uniref:Sulfatase-like hydrolase/transferase n=2 Tax=Novosphingobium aquae TaxID=3133435 RepID=A0ABU8SA97_9SPHN